MAITIYNTKFYLFSTCGTFKCVLVRHILQLRMRFCRNPHFKVQDPYSSHVVFHTVRAGVYWHKEDDTYACAFAEPTK